METWKNLRSDSPKLAEQVATDPVLADCSQQTLAVKYMSQQPRLKARGLTPNGWQVVHVFCKLGPPLTKSKRQPHDEPTRSIMAELMPQCITNHKATLFPTSHNNKPAKADVGTQQIKQNTSCEQYCLILLSLYCWGACAWRAASRTDCKLRRPREVAFVKPLGREQLPSRTCWEMPPETKIHCENSAFLRMPRP